MEEGAVKIIQEEDRYYIVNDNKKQQVFSIDQEKIEEIQNENYKKILKNLSVETEEKLYEEILKILPLALIFTKYPTLASNITDILFKAYLEVGSPNMLHWELKGIDPKVYGRSEDLFSSLTNILEIINYIRIIRGDVELSEQKRDIILISKPTFNDEKQMEFSKKFLNFVKKFDINIEIAENLSYNVTKRT